MLLFVVDLLFPIITRTLFQYFTCRNLRAAGTWLEADMSVNCESEKYKRYSPFVGVFAVLWACGVPVLFLCLVNRFEHHGKAGDKVVEAAIGWMCTSTDRLTDF